MKKKGFKLFPLVTSDYIDENLDLTLKNVRIPCAKK